jgi:hypothetical protein
MHMERKSDAEALGKQERPSGANRFAASLVAVRGKYDVDSNPCS